MSTRLRRAAAAAALTVASLAGTAALATPAFAADTVRVSFGNLILSGGPENNTIQFTPVGNTIEVRELNSVVLTAGPGCKQVDSRTALCRGVQNINANGQGGNDVLDNSRTNVTSVLGGGNDGDQLIGGSNNDQLIGGLGTDNANGGPGQDICNAEGESNCELN
jgi:Ca2+-binding RTX toxin-like protein